MGGALSAAARFLNLRRRPLLAWPGGEGRPEGSGRPGGSRPLARPEGGRGLWGLLGTGTWKRCGAAPGSKGGVLRSFGLCGAAGGSRGALLGLREAGGGGVRPAAPVV